MSDPARARHGRTAGGAPRRAAMTGLDDLPRWVWPALVALVAAGVYLNALPNGFALDDLPLVRDNPDLRELSSLPRLLVSSYWPGGAVAGLYRPVTIASLSLNRAVLGSAPWGFHAVNVLLHALVSLLVWQAVRRVAVHYGTALLAGLLFAVHPLHTEAVANVAGRAELLAALFVLLAWACHREATATEGRRRWAAWVGAAACYLLAVLSKEHAVLAPLLFALDERWVHSAGRRRRRALVYVGYGAALALAGALRLVALGGLRGAEDVAFLDNPAAFAGPAVRTATALWVQLRYAWLFVWPARLSSDYSYDAIPNVATPDDPRLWAGVAFVVALVVVALYGWRRSRPLALGSAIWLLFFLPTANLLFPVGTVMAERLAYLPSLGACMLVGHLGAWFGARARGRAALATVVVACTLAVLALGLRTVARNPAWADNLTLATRDADTQPRSAKLQAGAGIARFEHGDAAGAERAFRAALAIYPDYAQIQFNLGQLLHERGATDEAIRHLSRAAALSPTNPRPRESLNRIAAELEAAGRTAEALDAWGAVAHHYAGDHGARFNYGRLLLATGDAARAREVLAALASDDRRGIPGRLAAGLVAELEGRPDAAAERYREVLARTDVPTAIRRRVERLLAAVEQPRQLPDR